MNFLFRVQVKECCDTKYFRTYYIRPGRTKVPPVRILNGCPTFISILSKKNFGNSQNRWSTQRLKTHPKTGPFANISQISVLISLKVNHLHFT